MSIKCRVAIIAGAEILVVKFWERLVDALPTGMLYEVKLRETENNLASYRGE
jgi:hypothetical protein